MSDTSTARPTILPSDPAPIVPAAPSDPLMDALSALESRVNALEARVSLRLPGEIASAESIVNADAAKADHWAREKIAALAGHLGVTL